MQTVTLEFEVDEQVPHRDRRHDPARAAQALLSETYLEMPITLQIGETKVFDGEPIPIYAIAVKGLEVLRELPRKQRANMVLPLIGGLTLHLEGDQVTVYYPAWGGRSAQANYDELVRAWESFADHVRQFLLTEFPRLAEHPEPTVRAWFRRER